MFIYKISNLSIYIFEIDNNTEFIITSWGKIGTEVLEKFLKSFQPSLTLS